MRRPRTAVPALALLAGATAALCTGCTVRGYQRVVVVHFAPGATPADRDTASSACSHLPGVLSVQSSLDVLRFDVTGAAEREVAALYSCLAGQPHVAGVTEPD